jgi:RNA polymerase sigma-70 factor, ECF subfamily
MTPAPARGATPLRHSVSTEQRLRAWMLLSRAGDRRASIRLLTELRGRLRTYFARHLSSQDGDVDDLVQETLLTIHLKGDTYDPNRPFTPWVHTLGRHKLIDHLRRTRDRRAAPLEAAATIASPESTELEEIRLDVDRLLSRLPDHRRRLVEDIKILGFSVAEVAAARGVSAVAARVAAHRSLQRLRQACGCAS